MIRKYEMLILFILMLSSVNTNAQDTIPKKMQRIDCLCDSIYLAKYNCKRISYPLKWNDTSDSIHYYISRNELILIEHISDYEPDTDGSEIRIVAYKRMFFFNNKLCREDEYSSGYDTDKGYKLENGSTKNVSETRVYYDLVSDREVYCVRRNAKGSWLNADSVTNITNWIYSEVFKYSKGRLAFQKYLNQIKTYGFLLPEGTIMPYELSRRSEIENKKK